MAAPVSKRIADQRIHVMGVISAGASGSAAYVEEADVNGQSSVIPYGLLSKLLTVTHGNSELDAGIRVVWPWHKLEALAACDETHCLIVKALV